MSESSGQSTTSPKSVWRYASFALILGGVALMGWGGWTLYQQQVEASKPPPAPIVNSLDKLANDSGLTFATLTPTSTPTPPPASSTPEPTVEVEADDNVVSGEPEPTATPLVVTATPTITPDPNEQVSVVPVTPDPIIEDLASADDTISVRDAPAAAEPEPVAESSAPSTEENTLEKIEQALAGTGEVGGSLNENPLIVDSSAIFGDETAIAQQSVSRAEGPPPTRLVADGINLDTPIVGVGWEQVSQNGQFVNVWSVAEYAAGWHQNSMLPGQGGNVVLSGHHNVKGAVFRDLVEIELGEIITLYVGEEAYEYKIEEKFIVKDLGEPEEVRIANARWIGPFEDERVTMVTCWPFNSNTHRVIVIAKPV